MSLDETLNEAIEPFIDKGLISEVLTLLKSGKEATVYCCRGGHRLRGQLVAVKVYRPMEHRQFRNDAVYREGRVIVSGRVRRAVENGSAFGKQMSFGMWVGREWEHLRELHKARLDIPRPIDTAGDAVVMQYLGDELAPAPQLRAVRLTEPQALGVWGRVVWNVQQMLSLNRVHGDLSPYNLLWHDQIAWIIDVPQMIDARENPSARSMLDRDLENVWRYCSKFAQLPDPWKTANQMWERWRRAEL
jgi:RIO kinase 1